MYFNDHKSRDTFCFSEGHEILLSDSRTIETGFYSQNRSKIILQDGERRCVVGVQFATCASVPVYNSMMHNHIFSICSNNVLHRSSEVEFESLCAACGVNVFGKTTRSRALLNGSSPLAGGLLKTKDSNALPKNRRTSVLLFGGASLLFFLKPQHTAYHPVVKPPGSTSLEARSATVTTSTHSVS